MLEQTNEEKKKKIDTQGLRNAVTNTAEKLYQNKIRDVQAKTNAVQPERVQNAEGVNDGKSKSLKDYSIMSPDRRSNGIETDDKSSFDGKKFKSRYIDNNGAWTHEAVDDGYVEFNDYIKDRRDGVDNGISFNGKEFSASSLHPSSEPYEKDVLYGNEYVRYDVDEDPIEYYYSEDYDTLEPYTISDNLGETAGVGDFFWSGVDNTVRFSEKVKYGMEKSEWISSNLGFGVANKNAWYFQKAERDAEKKKKEWGLEVSYDNKADAYRHFIWNANLTRDNGVGYYNARNITNRYEYEELGKTDWLDVTQNPFEYKIDNTKIRCKMNQPVLMDLWNNQVGRELANNTVFDDMTTDELFDMAVEYGWVIADATKVYEFLGITDYIMDPKDYYVNAEWDLTTGNIVFSNDDKRVELKIGV